jgi:nifR3 family TIM-barrel protein
MKKMEISDFERPFGVQLYGHRIEAMVEAVKMAEEVQPDFIDLNFGCPVKKVANRGAGAGMLQYPDLMFEMTRAVVSATRLPVTVKTRLGWDENSIRIVENARMLQSAGIALLSIHGRTRAQMYRGEADWEAIAAVKNHPEMEIPVIGNGDIAGPRDAERAFKKYGVDGIMIGRAAVGKPWLFKQIREYLDTGRIPDEPVVKEKSEVAKKHLTKSLEWKGHPRGIYEMRKHLSNYFKGLPNFKPIKQKLVTTLDSGEIYETLDYIAEKYRDFDSSQLKSNSFFHY